eukprot:scaffold944_cov115-Alexandrium_tamarense.AAC.13
MQTQGEDIQPARGRYVEDCIWKRLVKPSSAVIALISLEQWFRLTFTSLVGHFTTRKIISLLFALSEELLITNASGRKAGSRRKRFFASRLKRLAMRHVWGVND